MTCKTFPFLFPTVLLALSSTAGSQTLATPTLVRDIHAAPAPVSSSLGNGASNPETQHFARIGVHSYFIARHPQYGVELFRSLGTKGSAKVVADINPGIAHSSPSYLTVLGTKLVFLANDGKAGGEPWVYDTQTQKAQLLKDIFPGFKGSSAAHLEEANGYVWFHATDGVNGQELWRTDGTPQGTQLVADINGGKADSFPIYFEALGSLVFFRAADANGGGLYRTDGTSAGTFRIASELVYGLTVYNGEVWYAGYSKTAGIGIELYRSDGTVSGTKLAFDIEKGSGASFPGNFAQCHGRLYFTARTTAAGNEIFWTDGTQVGVVDVLPGSPSSRSSALHVGGTAPNELLYFTGQLEAGSPRSAIGQEVGVYDGKTITTIDVNPGSASSTPSGFQRGPNGRVFFAATHPQYGVELFVSSGTQASTRLVADINKDQSGKASSLPKHLTPMLNGILFAAEDPMGAGRELWYSDGSAAGTQLVDDIDPRTQTPSSFPGDFLVFGDRLLFAAQDDQHGRELWSSDGSPKGTRMLADLLPGAESSRPTDLTRVGDLVFFVAEGYDAKAKTKLGKELHAYDVRRDQLTVLDLRTGTQGSNPIALTEWRGRLWFQADGNVGTNGDIGAELWTSDGTMSGTRLVADLNPGTAAGQPWLLTPWKSKLYFVATHATLGQELWATDGTSAGSAVAADLLPGTNSSRPLYLTPLRDLLVFRANMPNAGTELVAFDGKQARLIDIRPGSGSSSPDAVQGGLTLADSLRFVARNGNVFFRADDGVHGTELWISDGTQSGTNMLRDIVSGSFGARFGRIGAWGEQGALFSVDDGTVGFEPWVSDGTPKGTQLLKDLVTTGNSSPTNILAIGHRRTVFQCMGESSPGNTLGFDFCVTDGTKAGTNYIDMEPGSGASRPTEFALVGDRLFLAATSLLTGHELFVADLGAIARRQPSGCTASGQVLELLGTDPVLGTTTHIELRSDLRILPGALLLGSPARLPLPVGFGCDVHVDLSLPILAVPLLTDSGGEWRTTLGIPNSPGLRHIALTLQAIVGPSPSAPLGWDWSEELELHPGN